jgi:hypothetical protein
LTLIDKTTPIRIITLNELSENFVFIFYTLMSENGFEASEELTLKMSCLFWFDPEVNNSTPRMKRFNNLVDEVTGEDEAAVAVELLYGGPEGQLDIVSGVVCLVDDDDLVGRPRGQRDGASELTDAITHRV